MVFRCAMCQAPARYLVFAVDAASTPGAMPLAAFCAAHDPYGLAPRRPDSLARQLVREQMG